MCSKSVLQSRPFFKWSPNFKSAPLRIRLRLRPKNEQEKLTKYFKLSKPLIALFWNLFFSFAIFDKNRLNKITSKILTACFEAHKIATLTQGARSRLKKNRLRHAVCNTGITNYVHVYLTMNLEMLKCKVPFFIFYSII